jgi:hypothetical protein
MSQWDLARWVGGKQRGWGSWLRTTLFVVSIRLATAIGLALAYLLVRFVR